MLKGQSVVTNDAGFLRDFQKLFMKDLREFCGGRRGGTSESRSDCSNSQSCSATNSLERELSQIIEPPWNLLTTEGLSLDRFTHVIWILRKFSDCSQVFTRRRSQRVRPRFERKGNNRALTWKLQARSHSAAYIDWNIAVPIGTLGIFVGYKFRWEVTRSYFEKLSTGFLLRNSSVTIDIFFIFKWYWFGVLSRSKWATFCCIFIQSAQIVRRQPSVNCDVNRPILGRELQEDACSVPSTELPDSATGHGSISLNVKGIFEAAVFNTDLSHPPRSRFVSGVYS